MIVEWLLSVAAGLADFFVGLLPDWELPPELADPDGMLAGVFVLAQGVAPFADWAFVATVGAIPLAVWVIGIIWKAFRTLASHFPGFGGAG